MLTGDVSQSAIVEADCPYFFELRALIGERPNLVPVGLGNNDTAVDVSVVLPGIDGKGDDSSSDFLSWDFGNGIIEVGESEEDAGYEKVDVLSGEDLGEDAERNMSDTGSREGSEVVDVQVPAKRKIGVSTKAESVKKTKKNGPLPGTSTPTPKPVPSDSKKKTLVDRFADTSKAEEETVQKRIELRKEKVIA